MKSIKNPIRSKEVKLQPKLRFPEFMTEWKRVKLRDVSKYYNGGSFEGDVKEKGQYELITLKSVDMNGNLAHSNRFINLDVPRLKKNTLIMILSEQSPGLLGMTALIPVDNKYVLNQRVAEIRPNNEVDSYFLSLAININQPYFSKLGAGTKVQNITKPNVENYEFFLPTLPEQTKIASFLTTVDEKINGLKKQRTLLERYKKGVMQKIFSQELRFQDENGNDFAEWEKLAISQLFDSKKGSGLSKDKLSNTGKYKCLLYGELFTTYKEKITSIVSFTNSLEGVCVDENDILVPGSTTTSGIDLSKFSALKVSDVRVGGDVTILKSKRKIEPVFYAYYLSNFKKREIGNKAQGITIVHLSFSNFKDIIIDFPSFAEQQKIATFLSSIDEKIEKCQGQIKKMENWKKGLLQQMFV
jgi:type I restriction enzyme S subunit